ncbi:MAG TPA: hypothetical protein VNE42_04380 [Acidimicrobiales bacterium]|nr:hypothetical protein [Acidimicrobiales bacterium]
MSDATTETDATAGSSSTSAESISSGSTGSNFLSRNLLPLTRADRLVVALFVVLPLLIYGIPALAGHLIVPGDDLNQNLPLRILSGTFYRAGLMPAWNPLMWSGTPLLGGWNAGSIFPGTLLFAFLPVSAAWTINLAFAPAAAATGVYFLLRRFRVSEPAAGFGGLVFAYTGFMAGQIVHIGLIQGTAFTPWMLLSFDVLFRGTRSDKTLPFSLRSLVSSHSLLWIVVLATAISGTVLAGDPRAISSALVAGIIYLVALFLRKGAMRLTGSLLVAIATLLGALLSAPQLLPGLSFLHASQRGTTALGFFGAGSIPKREFFTLLFLPFSLGGNGNFGIPVFNGTFNLPELTISAGVLALVAVFALIPETIEQFTRRFSIRPNTNNNDPRRQLGIWYAFAIIGGVLAMGTTLPTGKLLVHLPFYGNERLQNRNIVLVDLALAVFVGIFLDRIVERLRTDRAVKEQLFANRARLAALVPVLVALGFIADELADPVGFQRALGVLTINPHLNSVLLGYLVPSAVIVVAIGVFIAFNHRLSTKLTRMAIVLIALIDVGFFISNSSFTSAPTSLFRPSTPYSIQLRHMLGGQGRFAFFDPYYQITGPLPEFVEEVGLPDLNVLQDNPSIQGYGSIVNGVYQRVTGSHLLNNLTSTILPGATVNTLDLRILLTPSSYLEHTIRTGQVTPLPSSMQHLAYGIPLMDNGPWRMSPGGTTTFQLSRPRRVRRVTFTFSPTMLSGGPVEVTALNGAKVIEQRVMIATKTEEFVKLNAAIPITTIVCSNTGRVPVELLSTVATTENPGQRFVLNGLLEGFLPSGHWVFAGNLGPLSVFKNTQIHGLAWLQPTSTRTPNTKAATSGRVNVTRGAVTSAQVMRVYTQSAAILVRAEAYSSGWSVDIAPIGGGPSTHQVVRRFGLVQQVTLPAGNSIVTWHYRPHALLQGLYLGGLGVLIWIGAVATIFARKRRLREIVVEQ